MELKAITCNYTEDGISKNKVVGIFTKEQLPAAWERIKAAYPANKIKREEAFDFLEYGDEQDTWFYSSNYVVGELNL